jgi:hypothetical protein
VGHDATDTNSLKHDKEAKYSGYYKHAGYKVDVVHDLEFMLRYLCKQGEYEVVGAYYRNQRMMYTENNPELAKKETSEAVIKQRASSQSQKVQPFLMPDPESVDGQSS